MLKLTVFPAAFSEISGSPFSVKAWVLLEQSGQPYEVDVNPDPRKAPKGKFPVLYHDGKAIPDSDHIRDYMEDTFGIDYDAGLSARQRAESRVLIRMAEEHLYFIIYANRWQIDTHWTITKDVFFSDMPKIIGPLIVKHIRKGALQQLMGQGVGRHSLQEQLKRAEKDIDAIAALLGDKKFLFGEKPSAADFSVVPMLRAAAGFPIENELGTLVTSNKKLVAYMERGLKTFYPPQALEAQS